MKRMLLFAMLFMVAGIASAQYTAKKTGGGDFGMGTAKLTDKTVTVENLKFEVWETKSGSEFVKALSKEGKEYPIWIGTETGDTFEGMPVRKSKNGSYFVLELTKAGQPRPFYLDKN
jgi:hypothetical protein